jgi:hypothetical protein
MIPSKIAIVIVLGSFVSIGCLGAEKPAADPNTATGNAEASSKPEGSPDMTDTTPGMGNTGNGSPGPEGGPGSLGAGLGAGSGTGTGAGPGNSGSTNGSVGGK